MRKKSIASAWIAALLALPGIPLAACADTHPMWDPNSPRNGAQQPVDAIYGTPIPGYPTISGRGR